MAFAAELGDSLQFRTTQAATEFRDGADLEQVLSRHLLAVEAMADGELITSILLLSEDGKRLSHCAAPGLPRPYCEVIDGSEIGPRAGSCGTAAYLGKPVYVGDIATDPLWAEYKELALPHGLRSCWSTPIRDPGGAVIGTFAIYRRAPGHPSNDEIAVIGMITEHVAEAIILARTVQDLGPLSHRAPRLRVVDGDHREFGLSSSKASRLLNLASRLRSQAEKLDRLADGRESADSAQLLKASADFGRKLSAVLCEIAKTGEDV